MGSAENLILRVGGHDRFSSPREWTLTRPPGTLGGMIFDTPHGEGRIFWCLGDEDFIRAAEGLSFVPLPLLEDFSLPVYQASRYGELSARCWPSVRVAHALPDIEQPASGAVVEAFAWRLCNLLADIPVL